MGGRTDSVSVDLMYEHLSMYAFAMFALASAVRQHRDIYGAGQKGGINCTCSFMKCTGTVAWQVRVDHDDGRQMGMGVGF